MSESVKILIEADDQASKKVAAAAANVEASIRQIKTTGEQAKKSTEFFGQIANALGGTELGGYASQLAGLTEKTSQFAEVQKLGGAGALAFKAGLVGVAGVLSFQVGKALGDVVFETQKWTDALVKADQRAQQLAASAAKALSARIAESSAAVNAAPAGAERALAAEREVERIRKEMIGVESQIKQARLESEVRSLKFLTESGNAQLAIAGKVRGFLDGNNAALQKQAEQRLSDLLAQNESLKEQEISMQAIANTTKDIADAEAKKAADQKSDDYLARLREELTLLRAKKSEIAGIEASRNTSNAAAQDEAVSLLQEKEAIAAKKQSDEYIKKLREELELLSAKKSAIAGIEAARNTSDAASTAEAQRLIEQRELLKQKQLEEEKVAAKAEQVNQIRQRELENLEKQQIELKKGKEAAQAFALEKQGLSQADAVRIAAEQAGIDAEIARRQQLEREAEKLRIAEEKANTDAENKRNEQLKKANQPAASLQAQESRLETRSNGSDPAAKSEQHLARIVALQQKQLDRAEKEKNRPKGRVTTLTVVSG